MHHSRLNIRSPQLLSPEAALRLHALCLPWHTLFQSCARRPDVQVPVTICSSPLPQTVAMLAQSAYRAHRGPRMTPAEEATIIDLADPLTWPITHVLCDAHEEEVEEKSMATGPAVASRDNPPEVFPRSQPCRQQACLPFGTATRQSGSQPASQPASHRASQSASQLGSPPELGRVHKFSSHRCSVEPLRVEGLLMHAFLNLCTRLDSCMPQ